MSEETNPFQPNNRYDFQYGSLLEKDVNDPAMFFARWLQEAIEQNVPEADAFVLATVSEDGTPSTRILYVRELIDQSPVFYTNYQSRKGMDILKNPRMAMNFFWPQLERQIKIRGKARKVSPEVSDAYFMSRPRASRIGAWASRQSQELDSRQELELKVEKMTVHFEGREVTRPPHWGGYAVDMDYIEFWQGRPSRLHDRIACTRLEDGSWNMKRLSP